jgi:hypothetical protein
MPRSTSSHLWLQLRDRLVEARLALPRHGWPAFSIWYLVFGIWYLEPAVFSIYLSVFSIQYPVDRRVCVHDARRPRLPCYTMP